MSTAPQTNAAKLEAFVAGHIAIAAKKPPAEAEAHLMGWATWVNDQMAAIARSGVTPAHLVGVDGWMLANARDALIAAVPRKVAA